MTPDPFVKICGITRLDDALHAVQQGTTALGFVFWPGSPRCVTAEHAREIVTAVPATIVTVGVFVNESIDGIRKVVDRSGISAVQLHGDEPPSYVAALDRPVLRGMSVDDALEACASWPEEATLLLDANDRVRHGGTGLTVDWIQAANLARRRRVVLAGGLTPENVADAIATVQPFGVDVSSGVEEKPGVKDLDKVSRFLQNARRAFAQG